MKQSLLALTCGVYSLLLLAVTGCTRPTPAPTLVQPQNPVIAGWYADPEAAVFAGRYWIYPTFSAPYEEQLHFDAFSSDDLLTWKKHANVLEAAAVPWARRAMWAPAVVERRGRYYFFFAANDIQNDTESGGIGVAVADRPDGPFRDLLGWPLIDRFHNGAQPIDQFVFRDTDGTDYIIYGGWRHCNVARLKPDFTGLLPLPDGQPAELYRGSAGVSPAGAPPSEPRPVGSGSAVSHTFKEITPEGYVEGPFMFVRDGKYYFMWSEGGWTGPNYSVAYAIGDSVLGPFTRIGTVLRQDPAVGTGAGHHSVLRDPKNGQYYIVYHRRPLGETDANHRVVCIEPLFFDTEGHILPVKLTGR